MEIVIISQNKWNKAMSIKWQKHLPATPPPPPPPPPAHTQNGSNIISTVEYCNSKIGVR